MKGLSSLQSLIFELKKLPGVGPRSAQRLAQHLLSAGDQDIKQLSRSLWDLKSKVKQCARCFGWTEEKKLCAFCGDSSRDSSLLCAVEQPFDVFRIESCGNFRGYYHVLRGAISPLNHIHPKDLTLEELRGRVAKEGVKELILALDFDLEGDTTALYIARGFEGSELKISRLAQGIPIGGDLDFVDDRTLGRALENRSGI